jgi:hypothetical protein
VPTTRDLFRAWTTGTLLYVVVMGFFDDYTPYLQIRSHSTLVLAAAVLQVLTMGTLMLKQVVKARIQGPSNEQRAVAVGLAIWAILFVSKFVFLGVLDLVFGASVQVSGFLGLTAIVAATLVVDKALERIDLSLAGAGTER